MFTVSPSIYSGDFLHLADQLDALGGIRTLHLDIDDGNFVRGISFGEDIAAQIAAYTDIPLDAHIEAVNPMQYAASLCDICYLVSAHIEALPFPSLFLSTVQARGRKAGLALNLKTPVSVLEPYADRLDQVILVSVEADCEGLPFRRGVLNKIRQAKALLGSRTAVWVDGGIDAGNIAEVAAAGADGVVIGRAVFSAADPRAAVAEFERMGAAAGAEGEAASHDV